MKKHIFLFIAVLFTSNTIYSQTEDEKVFPESDAIWVIHLYEPKKDAGVQYIYGLSGDTIVNEKKYSKLYLLNDSTLSIDAEDIYVAGIRQDDKKVYVQPADKSDGSVFEEFLMYDFSKEEIGEAIEFGKNPLMGGDYYCPTFECVDIENIQIVSERIVSKDNDMIHVYGFGYWMKGIGSLSGLYYLVRRIPTSPSVGYGAELICMKEKGEIKYLGDRCNSCFENLPDAVSIDDEKIREFAQVKYNSSNKTVELSTETINLPYRFKLLNLEGKELMSYPIIETNININLSGLLSGVYIYTISGENVKQTGKIVVK